MKHKFGRMYSMLWQYQREFSIFAQKAENSEHFQKAYFIINNNNTIKCELLSQNFLEECD